MTKTKPAAAVAAPEKPAAPSPVAVAAPKPVSAATSPEKPATASALMEQLQALVAAAEPGAAKQLVGELKALVAACADVVAAKEQRKSAQAMGAVKFEFPELGCVQPRGKLALRVGETALCCVDPKKGDTKFEASFADVRAVLVVPPVESSKPGEAATLVLAAMPRPPPLAEPPSTKQMVDAYKKASLTASLADKVARVPLDAAALGRAFPQLRILGGATLGDALPEALARATACGAVEPVLKGAPGAGTTFFASLGTRAPYVRANLGSSQGHLHLTAAGLFFHKSPCLFLPVSLIASIACGRAGAANCSSFDLVVEMENPYGGDGDGDGAKKPPTFEFANVNKDELPEIQRFIRDVILKARDKALKAAKGDAGDAAADDAADDSDDDDDDFDPDKDSDDSDESDDDDEEKPAGDAAAADDTDSDREGGGDDDDGDFESDDSDDSEDDASDDGLKPGGLEDEKIEAPKNKKRRM